MSKVGKLPVAIPAGVTVTVANGQMVVKGAKGELKQSIHEEIEIKVENGQAVLSTKNDAKQTNAYHGLYRSLLANMVLPDPGQPINKQLWPPAAAISKALLTFSWPFTSEKSYS